MHLYLIQHGQAASREQDPDRPLTQEGRAETQKVARFLQSLGLAVDRLWHSGKTRARQTAEIYSEAFATPAGPSERQGLSPNDDVAPVRDELAVATEDTVIVGHMPFLSRLASLLLTGYENTDVVRFRYAGVVSLDRTPDNRWQVAWIVTPDIIL
jgi:phosphohistidine phosphatase